MPQALTKLERDVLDWLVEYVRRNTYQPSIREIGSEFGIKSTKTVSELLQSLADKGWIERDASRSRGVRLLGMELDTDVISVPHVDLQIGDLSLDDPVESIALDRRIAGSAGSFLVTVVGDTMTDEGIRDGDLVLVEPMPEEDLIDGDLVLCRLDGQHALRRLRREGSQILLFPGRSVASGALRTARDRILGRIGAVVRRLRTDSPLGRAAPEPADEAVTAG